MRTRYLVIINLANGRTAERTAAAVQVARSSVYRIARRFREVGEAGLVDRREENGQRKLDEQHLHPLWKLTQHYAQANVIHVVLDNDSIHSTQQVVLSLETEQGRRPRLHFLPPYCPDHNRIERVWEDLHVNVTRNHTCREMPRLMRRVRGYLSRRNHRNRHNTSA